MEVIVLTGVACCCGCLCWRWRRRRKRSRQDKDLVKTLRERDSTTLMSLRELKKATKNFAKSMQIGEGGFGSVYRGNLKGGVTVAIKRGHHEGSKQDKEIFLNEVRILSQVIHKHLVKLVGCCMENKIALLVFEFVSNGTLQEHLEGRVGVRSLSWKQRLNIAVQTADALNYLHSTATTLPIFHRDVKSANILLNSDFDAKVADFGISKLAHQATLASTMQVRGTFGYIDPVYMTSGQFTDKSDVYSFGVVLLELLSAKAAIQKPTTDRLLDVDEVSLVNFAKPHISSGDLQGLIDPALVETYCDVAGRESILNVGVLAMRCVDMQSKARPRMKEVWKDLQTVVLELDGTSSRTSSQHTGSVNWDNQIYQYNKLFGKEDDINVESQGILGPCWAVGVLGLNVQVLNSHAKDSRRKTEIPVENSWWIGVFTGQDCVVMRRSTQTSPHTATHRTILLMVPKLKPNQTVTVVESVKNVQAVTDGQATCKEESC